MLDARNYRQAIRMCEMKDVEKWPTARALKAWALAQMGRREQALEVCREVASRTPTDMSTLSALDSTFRTLGASSEAGDMFLAASKLQPSNADILRELYGCSLAQGSYLQAQQAALRLYKITHDRQHAMWAVSCIVVQNQLGENVALLEVGARVIEKAVGSGGDSGGNVNGNSCLQGCSPLTRQELCLFLDVLKRQGKFDEALAALRKHGPSKAESKHDTKGIFMQWSERLEMEADLLSHCGQLEEACCTYLKLLEVDRERWDVFQAYLATQEKAIGGVDIPFHRLAASLTPDILRVRGHIEEQERRSPPIISRSPFLAELEMLRRLFLVAGQSDRLPQEWLPRMQERQNSTFPEDGRPVSALCMAILAFFTRFLRKPCLFQDLVPYLSLFFKLRGGDAASVRASEEERALLLRQFEHAKLSASEKLSDNLISSGQAQIDETLGLVRAYIGASQICRFLRTEVTERGEGGGEGTDVRQRKSDVHDFVTHYIASHWINESSDGGQREVQLGDDLVLLATYELQDIRSKCSSSLGQHMLLVEQLTLLEYGMSLSPFNFRMKMLAIEAYAEIGSFERGLKLYNDLDTKHIQVETLSWLLYPGCIRCGFFSEAKARCNNIISLHKSSSHETADRSAEASMRGNYAQMIDMIDFQKRRMDSSLQLTLAKAQTVLLELFLSHHKLPSASSYLKSFAMGMLPESFHVTKEECRALSDNMDFSVKCSWELESGREEAHASQRARFELHILRTQALAAVLCKALNRVGGDEEFSQLESLLPGFSRTTDGKNGAPLPTSEGGLEIMNVAWRLLSASLSCLLSSNKSKTVEFDRAREATCAAQKLLHHFVSEGQPWLSNGNNNDLFGLTPGFARWLEGISKVCLNIIGPLCLVMQALHSIMGHSKTIGGKGQKKGKKKTKEPTQGGSSEELTEAEAAIKSMGDAFAELLRGLVKALSLAASNIEEHVRSSDMAKSFAAIKGAAEQREWVICDLDEKLSTQAGKTLAVVLLGQSQGLHRLHDMLGEMLRALGM